MSGTNFRAGVVIVVRHPDLRRVLAFERADLAGQWQLPQGGLNRGETPIEGAWRELLEETGLGPESVLARAEYPEWLVYEWPDDVKAARGDGGRRIGQAQRWFLFDAHHDEVQPVPDGREFVAWRWVKPDWLIDHVAGFRRPAYERVLGSL